MSYRTIDDDLAKARMNISRAPRDIPFIELFELFEAARKAHEVVQDASIQRMINTHQASKR